MKQSKLKSVSTKRLVDYLLKYHRFYEVKTSPDSVTIADIEIKQIKTPKDANANTCCGDIYGFSVNGKDVYLHDEILMHGDSELFFKIVKLYNKIMYRKKPTAAKVVDLGAKVALPVVNTKEKVANWWNNKNVGTYIVSFAWVVVYTGMVGFGGYIIGQQEQQKKDIPEFEKKTERAIPTPTQPESTTVLYGDVRDFQIPTEKCLDSVKSDTVPERKVQQDLGVIYGDVRDFILDNNQNTK